MIRFLINKPIAVLMSALAVTILGILAAKKIPISLMPDIDVPEITIQIDGEGYSSRELENILVSPIRSHLSHLRYLENIESRTSNGSAFIHLKLAYGAPIDYVYMEANEKIDKSLGDFPSDVPRPIVVKANATDLPVLNIDLTLKQSKDPISSKVSQEFIDLSLFSQQVIRKRIEQIPEVAFVDVNGLVHPEIKIVPDSEKLTALNISVDEIESAIHDENFKIESIIVNEGQYQFNLNIGNTIRNIEDLEKVKISTEGRILKLIDVAQITEVIKERRGLVLSNGKEAITFSIIKKVDARMDDLKKSLDVSLFHMEKDYPEIEFTSMRNQTKLLDFSIGNLKQSLFWGLALTFIVMFLFLRDAKSPLLIAISLPLSILVCLLLFQLFGITINIISLSGLILGIGLMIDNAIIVIDNIQQQRDLGLNLLESCVKGANEVFKPLLSSMLTTCAVFVPLIFLNGISGALFFDQAVTVTIGLFASLLISLTLIPVLYRLIYEHRNQAIENLQVRLKKMKPIAYLKNYEKGFHWVMKNQAIVYGIIIVLIFSNIIFFYSIPKQKLPELTSTDTVVKIDWNEQISSNENKDRVLRLLRGHQDLIQNYNAQIGNQQFLMVRDGNKGAEETQIYIQAVNMENLSSLKGFLMAEIHKDYPAAIVNFSAVDNLFNIIFSSDESILTVKIGNITSAQEGNLSNLEKMISDIGLKLGDKASVPSIPLNEKIRLIVDAEKLMTYGVEKEQLYNALKKGFNTKKVLSLFPNNQELPVILGSEYKGLSEVLDRTKVLANDSIYYNVKSFLKEVRYLDLETITAGAEGEYYPLNLNINEGSESYVLSELDSIFNQVPEYFISYSGKLFQRDELVSEFGIVLVITILLLYFILASQFESLTLPLIILLEIPVSLSGALGLLALFGMEINLMSLIGIVVMTGIIINDSILKIDTIIRLRRQGFSIMRSLLIAGKRRLKPILMTSLTTILALIPILVSGGIGSELQAPLAIALIGGMTVGTMVSLYLIPLCYYNLSQK